MSPLIAFGLKAYAEDAPPEMCPVCSTLYADGETDDDDVIVSGLYAAVGCCLWKDFNALERQRIAEAIEAGATWLEAINGVTA